MSRHIEAAAEIEAFSDREVAPLVHDCAEPLGAGVFQSADPVRYAEARSATYTAVDIGWRWGPVWSNAWFRLRGVAPEAMKGRSVCLRFSSGTEATLWQGGEPVQGFDLNHEMASLRRTYNPGEPVELWVEAACNRPLGATTFFWDDAAEVERWKEAKPGRFERAELVTVNEAVWRLRHALTFAARLVKQLDGEGAGLAEKLAAIRERLVKAGISPAANEAVEAIRGAMKRSSKAASVCHAVGHAHIDTAWLWRLRETRRKCVRTFASALELMERYPDFKFLCSQAQQYAWVEEDSPQLFGRLRERVMEGRWEPGGAMWIEPDCNIPSGESLIRQVLHGTRYWRERFGDRGEQSYLYLPDTFGFPASLPQIIEQAGLKAFITNKLGWNETNEFPYATFFWKGIDGTRVLSHCMPGMEYNSTLTPRELSKGETNHVKRHGGKTRDWLQPFGFGNGGGGPTDWMILESELAADCVGMPRVKLSDARSFCEAISGSTERCGPSGTSLPEWEGELYLERHRGTYTTQAWIKRANRVAEEGLRTAEWLACAGPRLPSPVELKAVAASLDEAWKVTLLNQFHDILPGSSVGEVYADAREQYRAVDRATEGVIKQALGGWSRGGGGFAVANPCSRARAGVVEVGSELRWVSGIPAMGIRSMDRDEPPVAPTVSGSTLSNGVISATIDEAGRIRSLRQADGSGEVVPRGGSTNNLVLYDDNPKYWEAWDIDEDYLNHADPVDAAADSWRIAECGPLRSVIEVSRALGERSRITQRFTLDAGSPRLDVRTVVDWHEHRKLLRVLFPTEVRSRNATYGIQFGHLSRPTHGETSWDKAKFEVCAHRWADLSEAGKGLAVLNDGKYGHSCHGGTLGLSLLRSTKFPDPNADMGRHEFTYSPMPHRGDWRGAGVDTEAEALNRSFVVVPGGGIESWAPFALSGTDGAAGIEVAAIKPSESGERVILRLVETRGLERLQVSVAWGMRVGRVESVDVAERPRPSVMLTHDRSGQQTRFAMRPFEIVTLAVERV